jgi:hypothetical protein
LFFSVTSIPRSIRARAPSPGNPPSVTRDVACPLSIASPDREAKSR